MDIEPGTLSEADKSDTALGGGWTKSLSLFLDSCTKNWKNIWYWMQKKPLMANLLRHLNTRRVDINYLKLVIQGSLW